MNNIIFKTKVSFDVQSNFIHENTTNFQNEKLIEIRNDKLQLIKSASPSEEIELEMGLYTFSVILDDGKKHESILEIKGDEPEVIVSFEKLSISAQENINVSFKEHLDIRVTNSDIIIKNMGMEMSSNSIFGELYYNVSKYFKSKKNQKVRINNLNASYMILNGASLVNEGKNIWFFKSVNHEFDEVPSANLFLNGKVFDISLPLNLHNQTNLNLCHLEIVDKKPYKLKVSISNGRQLAFAMQNMVFRGYFFEAIKLVEGGEKLLKGKYKDPTGAVLGALILRKSNKINKYVDWVENLAKDFKWLPDGKILLASIYLQQGKNQAKALKMILEASKLRILYTESLSILINLLRKWPEEVKTKKRKKAIKHLLKKNEIIDWDSIFLTKEKVKK